ncbi:hypothetical protein [Paenibacillus cremeus]|uniref:Uncharacterized protein n=1 Tax=Paenibacillus cremeus TaxID=2163881 RepID=A0A559JST7_9BACL|nr:hypothetical protein [Paenibacillus cremeus]TVY02927.1 hypothetical protein FPZ49_31575 [Paenibacillus cremeus]
MKKKWIMLGSAVGISSVVMISTGFSAMAATSGYDAYKSALKNTKTLQNVSVQAQANLQDNGTTLSSADSSFKLGIGSKTASGSVKVTDNGSDQSVIFYKQSGSTVAKPGSSDVYYVKQEGSQKKFREKKDNSSDEMSQQVETVIDALVGNLKDYVTINDNADGSKQIGIDLSNAQIPAVVNAIAPIAIKQATKEHKEKPVAAGKTDQPELFDEHALAANIPHLTQDIKIEKVTVKATVNADNYIEQQQADITVSGKDDTGAAHQLTVHLNANLSEFNTTTPDTIDLTGKQTQPLNQEHKGRGRG